MLSSTLRRGVVGFFRFPRSLHTFYTLPVRRKLFNFPQTFLRRNTCSAPRKEKPQLTPPPAGNGTGGSRPPIRGGILALFVAMSMGLSVAISFFLYRISSPTEVSWRVLTELLARGEVRTIQVSQGSSSAQILLHAAQYIDGKPVYIVRFPIENETALDFERRIRLFESKIGIEKSDQIPITVLQDMAYKDVVMTIVISSAIFATVVLMWMRKNLPRDLSPPQAIRAAVKKFSYQGERRLDPEKSNKESNEGSVPGTSKASPPPRADEPSVGGNFTGGFGSGLPFLDTFPGMGEPQPTTTNVTFDDVAGMHAAKEEVIEFVAYLRNPSKYQELGAKLPKGALLLGPPGTGKTLLVKALAHEAGVPFYSMAGSEFIEVIGGLGASRIRRLFQAARQKSPSIIFIDEIDSVGRRRSGSGPSGGGGASEMEQTLNQLLVEMDGMDTTEGTIVFAATNRADLLDKALLRAGRFDRHIFIDLPNKAERKEILDMYLAKYKLSKSIDVVILSDRLTTWTSGMAGADIARLCNEAALIAARSSESAVSIEAADFDSALERVLVGAAKRSNLLSLTERRVAAVQEAGRALVSSLLPHTGLTPFRISIVPRASSEDGNGLSFTQFIPMERRLMTTKDLADRIAVMLAGRAAEEIVFKAVSDASERYLKRATKLAYIGVREWGMSAAVGNLSFGARPESQLSLEPFSKRTAALIDSEVQRIIRQAFQCAVAIIQENEEKLHRLVEVLLEKEVISSSELKEIITGLT